MPRPSMPPQTLPTPSTIPLQAPFEPMPPSPAKTQLDRPPPVSPRNGYTPRVTRSQAAAQKPPPIDRLPMTGMLSVAYMSPYAQPRKFAVDCSPASNARGAQSSPPSSPTLHPVKVPAAVPATPALSIRSRLDEFADVVDDVEYSPGIEDAVLPGAQGIGLGIFRRARADSAPAPRESFDSLLAAAQVHLDSLPPNGPRNGFNPKSTERKGRADHKKHRRRQTIDNPVSVRSGFHSNMISILDFSRPPKPLKNSTTISELHDEVEVEDHSVTSTSSVDATSEALRGPTHRGHSNSTASTISLSLDPSKRRSFAPDDRPNGFTYRDIIIKEIRDAPNQRMLLQDIYGAIEERHPYFGQLWNERQEWAGRKGAGEKAPTDWRNSIRHNLSAQTIQIGPDPKGDKIKVFVRTDRSSTETDTQPSAEGAGKGGWWSLNPSAFLPNGDIRPTYSSKSIGKKRKAPPTADPAQKPGGAALPKTPGSTPGSASTGTVMWTPELTLPSRLSDPFVKKRDESDEFGVVPLPPGKKMRLDEALRDERYDVMQ